MKVITSKPYAVLPPSQPGRYYEQFGWQVVATATGRVVATGDERSMRRWALGLNRREA